MAAFAESNVSRWMNGRLAPDERARILLGAMTQQEKLTLVFGYYGNDAPWKGLQSAARSAAAIGGYVPNVPRLGIPPLSQADAGVGVASQRGPNPRLATDAATEVATTTIRLNAQILDIKGNPKVR